MKGSIACSFLLFLAANLFAADTPGIVATEPQGIRSVKVASGYMVPYKVKLTDEVSFEMIPIPGGKFKLGSPDSEKGRNKDEGPQVEVEIEPFWMGKCEVTWAEYRLWMNYIDRFQDFESKRVNGVNEKNIADAVSAPSLLYDPTFVFEHGEDKRLPAVAMTQFAARQYTKWLSKATGQIFRLSSEAEWEYACRAGTTTAYSFGDDEKQAGKYAWTAENSKEKPHFVGTKKPNPWGLHDMHGNVLEWTLDAHAKQGYERLVDFHLKRRDEQQALTNWPKAIYPRVVRGGCFEFDVPLARSAARLASDIAWQDTDPNIPKSPWWMTDNPCRAVGLRVVRPLNLPQPSNLNLYWEADCEENRKAVKEYLDMGSGRQGIVEPLKK